MPSGWCRANRVVPVAVEVMRLDLETGELVVGNLDRFLVEVAVERRLDAQPCLRRGVCNQTHDGRDALQWPPAPILRDVAEHTVLDLVPLARARRVVGDRDVEARLVGEALQLQFPQPCSVAIAPAA